MRLLHLSDTHLHAAGAVTHYAEIDTRARLESVLAASTGHGPFDAVALTGDICDDGSRAGAQAVSALIRDALPQAPILAAPGNHDVSEVVTEIFGPAPSHLGEWRVVVAATNRPRQIEGWAQGSVDALAALDRSDLSPILLLQHHPLRSASTHEWFVLREAERLELALAEFAAPIAVLTGHTHEAFDLVEGGVHHIGAPSTYYAIRHDGAAWTKTQTGTGALVVDLDTGGGAAVTPIWA